MQPSDPRPPTIDDFPETGVNALAEFGPRAWARMIDTVLIYVPLTFVALTLAIDLNDPQKQLEPATWLPFAWVALATLYEVVAVAGFGRTLGKAALGLRVARFVDGGNPTVDQAFLRCLLPLAAGVIVFVTLGPAVIGAALVYLSVLANPLTRGWHDQAGGTVVIRTR